MSGRRQTPTHWVDGRLRDDEPTPVAPWQQIVSVLALLWLFDFALGLRAREGSGHEAGPQGVAQLRAPLLAARDAAGAGERAIVLIGDSVLAGDVLAKARPDDWDRQRVVDHMRRGLARDSETRIEQVALDGLLPIDALHLVAELDHVDPAGEVELVVELDLRYFSAQYADQRECTRPELCELGQASLDGGTPALAWRGLVDAATRARDGLLERTPVHRRRAHADVRPLDQIPGLAVDREPATDPEPSAGEDDDDSEARARVREHYRSAKIDADRPERHAQLAALVALLDRAAARDRKLTLFLTPIEDTFAGRSFEPGELGRRYAALARIVNDYADPELSLLDLDHPLFVDAHFIDHVHLGVDGSRLLALNLVHELGLPLAERPREVEMVHPEGHDRTLVHRIDVGYAEGGAWAAMFDRAEGVAVSPDGSRIVVADTHNQVLRELRGNMQFVETLAGRPDRAARVDGPAREARLDRPRQPELLGDAVWWIDGKRRDALRTLERGYVHTPTLRGTPCAAYRSIRARPASEDRPAAIWALCGDSRLIHVDVEAGEARQVSDLSELPELADGKLVAFDLSPDTVYFADADGRLWQRPFVYADGRPRLGAWDKLFANTATELLPDSFHGGYPYAYDELRLAKVVELRYVERYGGLLVADEFPLNNNNKRIREELTERVHLRYFDLDAERILPWIKPTPHGEAHALSNRVGKQVVSYYHLGSMALAQDDASLVWVERRRSRLFRIADGLLGVAKTGNHQSTGVTIPMIQTLAGVSATVEAQLRPDRFLAARHEPIPREGPYVALLIGSSLSSMSDRLSNYSLGRRLELELQRELGYRDLIRLDLFQLSRGAASFGQNVESFATWMASSVPPDVVFIEAHDLGGGKHYMRTTQTRAEVVAKFTELRQLADRYDTLVVFYDLSSLEANRRDGMRSTDRETRALLDEAEALGFVVLDPGDRLLRELLTHSPWANQPFAQNQHHGAPWAIDLTARALASMVYPRLHEFFRDRVPARERERPADAFGASAAAQPVGPALATVELDVDRLPSIDPAYVQTRFANGRLQVFVDLAGFADAGGADLDELALAVIVRVLREDVYADFAELLSIQLVEFGNYDEYGDGVVESAETKWQAKFDRKALEKYLRDHAG